jgi:hypothetical protein
VRHPATASTTARRRGAISTTRRRFAAFATKAEWTARAETLRRQVRVALGPPWPERRR